MILQEMIVTNAEGKIKTATGEDLTGRCIQSEDMYTFYAIKRVNEPVSTPSSEKMAVKVKIMMPLGGELNGMYRFPRVGEKVVVAVEGTSHYLMGYLPTTEMPFSLKKDGKEKTDVFDDEGLVLRYKKTGANASDGQYSELSFTKKPVEWATADVALQKDKVSKAVTKDSKTSYYPYVDQVNLSSTGDIKSHAEYLNEITAQRVSMQAKFLNKDNTVKDTLTELTPKYNEIDKGDVYISADRRIILDAREGVLLKCGPVNVALSQTGLDLCCGKLGGEDETSGPFDAGLSMKTNGNFDIQGRNFKAVFNRSITMLDAFGANLSMTMGRSSLSGSSVSLEASTTLSSIFNGIVGATNLITQIASLFSSSKGFGTASQQVLFASMIAQKVGSFYTQTAKEKSPKKTADYVSIAIGIAYDIFDAIRTVFEKKRANQYTIHFDKEKKKFYNEDDRFATWSACMIVEASLQASILGIMLATSMDALIHKASISLTPHGDVAIDSRKYFQASIFNQQAAGPAAGVNANPPNGGGAGGGNNGGKFKRAMKAVGGAIQKRGWDMAGTISKVGMLETKAFAKFSMDDDTKQALKDL